MNSPVAGPTCPPCPSTHGWPDCVVKCANMPKAYREEQLVIPLIVVIVVVVVDVRPPGIIVREDGEQEEQQHRVAHTLLQDQCDEPLDALVKCNYRKDGKYPHLEAVRRRIEVHVLVRGHSRLVGALEYGVPAGARTEVPIHIACIILPKVPEDDDMSRRYQCGRQ